MAIDIVSVPIKNGDVHSYVSLPEGICIYIYIYMCIYIYIYVHIVDVPQNVQCIAMSMMLKNDGRPSLSGFWDTAPHFQTRPILELSTNSRFSMAHSQLSEKSSEEIDDGIIFVAGSHITYNCRCISDMHVNPCCFVWHPGRLAWNLHLSASRIEWNPHS